jgi:hypothetical protein
MTVGGDKPVYVDDVFAAVPYKGSDKATRWTPPLPIDAPTVTAYNSSAQFNDDGTLLFILNQPANYEIATLALPTPYSLEDATLVHSGDPTGGAASISGLPNGGFQFSSDGLILAIRSSNDYYTVPLATAWDLTTAGTPSTVTSITGRDTRGFLVVPDGSGFITQLIGSSGDRTLDIYDMSVPWDFSTATLSRSQLKNRISNSYYYVAAWSASGYFTSCAATTGGAVIESHGKAAPYVLSTGTSTSWDNSGGSGHRNNSAQTVGILHLSDNRTWLEVMSDGSSYWRQQLNIENGTELGVATTPISSTVDLAERGGMSWHKRRDIAADHRIFDTERGNANFLECNTTDSEASTYQQYAEPLVGGGMGVTKEEGQLNNAAGEYINWQLAKQEGFFDVVTYTGNGVAGREIAHNLGSTPGMMIVKRTTGSDNWNVYHSNLSNPLTKRLTLNSAGGEIDQSTSPQFPAVPTSDVFTVGSDTAVNFSNQEYVAYLFADDAPMFGPDGDESIIKCGSYTGTSDTNGPEIDLGWEPQFLLIKKSSGTENWIMLDTMRGIPTGGNFSRLNPNLTTAEQSNIPGLEVTATGFKLTGPYAEVNDNGDFIYMAIRRPNKPAKEFEPDELFAVDGSTTALGHSSPAFRNSGWQPGMAWYRDVSQTVAAQLSAPLMQGNRLDTTANAASTTSGFFEFDYPAGWGTGSAAANNYSWMFRRAPGFFDVVTYAGDGVAGRQLPHSLGVKPDMIWVKTTTNTYDWQVAFSKKDMTPAGDLKWRMQLNKNTGWGSSNEFNSENPTDSYIPLNNSVNTNFAGESYIAMMWASVPGICDIGSYTGDGSARVVDCGFTNGARFVLIKRTDSTGNWMYFDTLRGIGPNDDPFLNLNLSAAQTTNRDFLSANPVGFEVNGPSIADLVNTIGAEYIYMAIA